MFYKTLTVTKTTFQTSFLGGMSITIESTILKSTRWKVLGRVGLLSADIGLLIEAANLVLPIVLLQCLKRTSCLLSGVLDSNSLTRLQYVSSSGPWGLLRPGLAYNGATKLLTIVRAAVLLNIRPFVVFIWSSHRQPRQSLYEPHKQHTMASNYKGLYGIFYKISMEVVKSENSQ